MARQFISTLILILISACFSVEAQTSAAVQNNIKSVSKGTFYLMNDAQAEVKGSIFFNTEWCEGLIYSGTNTFSYEKIKYDAFNGVLLFVFKDLELVAELDAVDSFEISFAGQPRYFGKFRTPEDPEKFRFMEILYNGNIKLLAVRKKRLIKAEPKQSHYQENIAYDELKDATDFYLLKGKLPMKFKPSKNFFKENFPEKVGLDEFIKVSKIGFKEESDLVELFEYLNR
jgi:hypothetical protein